LKNISVGGSPIQGLAVVSGSELNVFVSSQRIIEGLCSQIES